MTILTEIRRLAARRYHSPWWGQPARQAPRPCQGNHHQAPAGGRGLHPTHHVHHPHSGSAPGGEQAPRHRAQPSRGPVGSESSWARWARDQVQRYQWQGESGVYRDGLDTEDIKR